MVDAGDPTPDPDGGDALVYVGRDNRGVQLHIIAVPDDKHPGRLAVIRCTPNDWRKP